MNVLVTGAKGQLGIDVVQELKLRNIIVFGYAKSDMDITDPVQVRQCITSNKIDVVVHCAAYTAVDLAEVNKTECELVNIQGTKNIACVCRELNIKMIYISTDYVFDGTGNIPWETDSVKNPINYYGYTKSEGEDIVTSLLNKYFIVRISWVFGDNGKNFVKTMLKLAEDNSEISVVNDQFGSPTYSKDLSKLITMMALSDKYGVYHATNEGYCSWYEFALEIFRLKNIDIKVIPVDSKTFTTRAIRPKNSMMSKEKLVRMGFDTLPTWQDALKRYLESKPQ